MHHLPRLLIVVFCIVYGFLYFGVDLEDVRRIFSGGEVITEKKLFDAPAGLTDDIFDKCKLTNGPLWDDNLRKWLIPEYDPMSKCNHSYVPWTMLLEDGRANVTEAAPRGAKCRARAVLLRTEFRHNLTEWHDFDEEFVFENDIVEVECSVKNKTAYDFLHYQVWPATRKKKQSRTARESERKPPSVYIIVLDSIGASHGRRVYNQTHRFLKEQFGAIEMQHVNKVGENSRPNGMAFLLGKLISNIKRDMYGLPSRAADWNYTTFCKSYLDNRGFVLKQFEKSGYTTMMAEDWDKGVFNWPGCWGFEKQPTTHYMRPFQLRLKDHVKLITDNMSGMQCFEPHLFLSGYLEKFIRAYPDSPKIALTWASDLGHDSPGKPFHSDKQYRAFFERNREEMDNSFVFFMGDHGLRFGWYSRHPIGRRDVDNPMLMFSVPRWLRNDTDLMSNLQRNSGELLTMFDTHATLVDIVETFAGKEEDRNMDFSERVEKKELMGTSLLRPLPDGARNCKTLPIPPQYCLCEMEKERLNITAEHDAIGAAIAAVANERVAEANASDICARLELDKVTSLQRIIGANDLYDVTVQLRPGKGIFQTFVRGSNGVFSVVVPDVTRLNKYGKDGDCTKINEIRTLCYCNSNLHRSSTPISKPKTRKTTKHR